MFEKSNILSTTLYSSEERLDHQVKLNDTMRRLVGQKQKEISVYLKTETINNQETSNIVSTPAEENHRQYQAYPLCLDYKTYTINLDYFTLSKFY